MLTRQTRCGGVTLVEVMVAITVSLVAIIGAMGYRYYSALDARKAKVQVTAGRLGSMLLENWRGTGGGSVPDGDFDPRYLTLGSKMTVSSISGTGPVPPTGFGQFGRYLIVADGASYYATLSYKDDMVNKLRVLNLTVAWPQKYPSGSYTSSDQSAFRSVRLTSKVDLPG